MWYLILGLIIGAILVYILVKHSVSTLFLTYYKRSIRSGESESDALKGAVNLFRYRKPFNQLTDDDVDFFVSEIMKASDPAMTASKIIQRCESVCDVSILKKEWILNEYNKAKN